MAPLDHLSLPVHMRCLLPEESNERSPGTLHYMLNSAAGSRNQLTIEMKVFCDAAYGPFPDIRERLIQSKETWHKWHERLTVAPVVETTVLQFLKASPHNPHQQSP